MLLFEAIFHFYFITLLGLAPRYYGLSFVAIAFSTLLGGLLSKKLHSYKTSQEIITFGLGFIFFSTLFLSLVVFLHLYVFPCVPCFLIGSTLVAYMVCSFGLIIVTSNALSLALTDYKKAIGTASSLFRFFYYCLISFFTFLMGFLHNGTLLPMPLYFLTLGSLMVLITIFYGKKF